MAKNYNPSTVEKELDKLSLEEMVVEYNRIGTVIHQKIVDHENGLEAQKKHSQELKTKLSIKESK